jgi:transcriptional regulator with XRE-family HTH domain
MLTTQPRGQAPPLGNSVWERHLLPLDLADELRSSRLELGLSLHQVAREAGISAPFLSRLERGLRAPRRPTAARLIRALALDDDTADELLGSAIDPWVPPSDCRDDDDGYPTDRALAGSPRDEAASR